MRSMSPIASLIRFHWHICTSKKYKSSWTGGSLSVKTYGSSIRIVCHWMRREHPSNVMIGMSLSVQITHRCACRYRQPLRTP